jgi:hypothetical protein
VERADIKQRTVPSVTKSNANTVVNWDKKATFWKLEANKSKRPEWWNDMAAATADEAELLL